MSNRILNTFFLVLTIIGLNSCEKSKTDNSKNLLPLPLEINSSSGSFSLHNNLNIVTKDKTLDPAAEYIGQILSTATGYKMLYNTKEEPSIILSLTKLTDKNPGAYEVNVTPENITINANEYQGIIYGIQTIRQLLPYQIESKIIVKNIVWKIPTLTISDAPRYQWRGLMLDESRHFFGVKEVKKLLDLMSLYKLNKFHWHLTDDQGWRIEIKKYPKLTQEGAWRHLNGQDRGCISRAKSEHNPDMLLQKDKLSIADGDTLYGGFYTQNDIKEIVKYAQIRGIDIIPEIDMPGHSMAAIENYNGISCFNSKERGVGFSSPICPGKKSALEFCKNVYKEIFDLFPYKYVHLGGDEVNKSNWKKCPDCQRTMKKNGLLNEKELQSWFIQYMEHFINENGKELIGWDDILEGGLSNSSAITWWRSWYPNAVDQTTAHGNKAILCPNTQYYFDYKQDKNTLQKLYEDEALPKNLSAEQEKLVLGLQANIWTEWIPSYTRLEYMMAPRILSLAENAWKAPSQRNWDSFKPRLTEQIKRLKEMNISYRLADVEGLLDNNVFVSSAKVEAECIDPNLVIHYTTDGSYPTILSKIYDHTLKITKSTNYIFAAFDEKGRHGDYTHAKYIKTTYAPGKKIKDKKSGLKIVHHEYRGQNCKGIEAAPVKNNYIEDSVCIPEGVEGDKGLVETGYIDIPQKGIYTFKLNSDDGSILYLDGKLIIENDGMHAPRTYSGQAALEKGLHTIKVLFFDYNGGTLSLNIFNKKGRSMDKKIKYYH